MSKRIALTTRLMRLLSWGHAYLIYWFLKGLGLRRASAFGAWVGRRMPWVLRRRHRQMLERIARAMPERSAEDVATIARNSWENLGRTMGEYPHLDHLEDNADISRAMARIPELEAAGALIFVCPHLANWEAQTVFSRLRLPFTVVARAPNSPAYAYFLRKMRARNVAGQIEKREHAVRRQLQILRQGGRIGTMFDVRFSEDLLYLFFGRPVQVTSAIARLGLAVGVPLYPARTERLEDGSLRMSAYPAIPHPNTGNKVQDSAIVTQLMMRLLERWVRARPGDYLWLHDLWGDTKRRKPKGQLAQLVFPELETYIERLGYDALIDSDPLVRDLPLPPLPEPMARPVQPVEQ